MGFIYVFLVAAVAAWVAATFGQAALGWLFVLFLVGFYVFFEGRAALLRWQRRQDGNSR